VLQGVQPEVYASVFGDDDELTSDTESSKTDALRARSANSAHGGISPKDVYACVFGDNDDVGSAADASKVLIKPANSVRGGLDPKSVLSESFLVRNEALPNTPVKHDNKAPEVMALRHNAQ